MSKMSAEEILNEVRRQQCEMNSTRRYKPDATLFISEDCWYTLLRDLPLESGCNNSTPESTRRLMGYTTVVVKGLKQYVELKENAKYGGRAGVSSYFDEWGFISEDGV